MSAWPWLVLLVPSGYWGCATGKAVAELELSAQRQRPVDFDADGAEAIGVDHHRGAVFGRRTPQRDIDDAARRGERISLRCQPDLDADATDQRAVRIVEVVEIEAFQADVAGLTG